MARAAAAVRLPPELQPHGGTALPPSTRAGNKTVPGPGEGVRVEALPRPLSAGSVDLQALARGFAADEKKPPAAGAQSVLLVFVSFSMPKASLQRLVDQAERSGAILVLRGFDNGSLKATVARVQAMIGKRRIGFQIDPQAFSRYQVRAVPSFVLTAGAVPLPCAGAQCQAGSNYVLVSGDVTIDYALEHFEQRAPQFRNQSRALLRKMKG